MEKQFFVRSFGFLVFIFIQLLYLINLLQYEQVSITEAFYLSTNPKLNVFYATLPSLIISLITTAKLYLRYRKVKNDVAFFMMSFVLFVVLTLFSTLISFISSGYGKLSLYFDRTAFNAFVIACLYLYQFMNEVFRVDSVKISKLEVIFIVICVIAPLLSTAFRQTHDLPNLIENISLAVGGIVILYPNFGIAYYSLKISRKLKNDNIMASESTRGFRYMFLSSVFLIVFTVFFVIIVLEELYSTWLFFYTMILVAVMVILFYKSYVNPK